MKHVECINSAPRTMNVIIVWIAQFYNYHSSCAENYEISRILIIIMVRIRGWIETLWIHHSKLPYFCSYAQNDDQSNHIFAFEFIIIMQHYE